MPDPQRIEIDLTERPGSWAETGLDVSSGYAVGGVEHVTANDRGMLVHTTEQTAYGLAWDGFTPAERHTLAGFLELRHLDHAVAQMERRQLADRDGSEDLVKPSPERQRGTKLQPTSWAEASPDRPRAYLQIRPADLDGAAWVVFGEARDAESWALLVGEIEECGPAGLAIRIETMTPAEVAALDEFGGW